MSLDTGRPALFSSEPAVSNVIDFVVGEPISSEERCRDILQALPAAIYTTDADGRITFYNEAAVAFSGRRPALGSDSWCVSWKLFWPDGTPLPHDQCPMAVALREDRTIRGVEAIAERPDGSRIAFMPYPTPIHDGAGRLIGAVNMLVDITDRKAAEDRLIMLAREVDHRANNLLAVVQATVRLTEADTIEDFKSIVEGRIRALGRAHSLLARSRWMGADLGQLVEEELLAFGEPEDGRWMLEGPTVKLPASAAQSMAVALHELATNAAKYGALSAEGCVDVRWRLSAAGRLQLQWTETGGPPVSPPARRGFGSIVVQSAILRDLCGEVSLDWRPEGLVCTIEAELSPAETPAH